MKLSVIIPICNEYPQILFTLDRLRVTVDVFNNIKGPDSMEVIVIDNWCDEVSKQIISYKDCAGCNAPQVFHDVKNPVYRKQDQGGEKVESLTKLHPWLKYFKYQEKLSHWQAKNLGVKMSQGAVLFFIDGHCLLPTTRLLVDMYERYTNTSQYVVFKNQYLWETSTLHLPILYMMDTPARGLIYKPVCNLDTAEYHYSFTRRREENRPIYEVPCMSTCGMMISRELYDCVGGWPTELGIYGGGENFLNYTLAVLGKHKYIYDENCDYVSHFAEKRGYNFNATDYLRNRLIATYIFGGEEKIRQCAEHCKGRPETIQKIVEDVLVKCKAHRELIAAKQVIDIDTWVKTVMPLLL